MSYEPFNKLVKLAARAFYDDYTTKGDNQPKSGRSDNRGIAVVVLDALTRRQWVREEDLAKDLKLHSKQLRRIIRFFEEEKLITRESRKETAKGAKVFSAAVAATHDGIKKEGDDKLKFHTHSYCCLDYAQIYDIVRYRLHRVKKKLKDELDNRNTVQVYVCPNCNRRYTALDALRLISMEDEFFHCEKCDGELVAESDKLAAEEPGDGDDNRKQRREKLKNQLQKMEEQLKPLMEQLNRVKDLTIPEFGNLLAWEHRANAGARGGGDAGANGGNRSQGGTPMPFTGDTKVEVDFGDLKEDVKPETGTSGLKVLPPWMIMQGMNLTKEQRGEVNQGDDAPSSMDDKKSAVETDDKKNIQDEYLKAYYAALLQKQQEVEAAQKQQEIDVKPAIDTGPSSSRQVGMKVKREDDGEEDVDWEESNAADTNASFKLNDLNVEAKEEEASPEDDDDVDWEED